jgi:hypothetical protein
MALVNNLPQECIGGDDVDQRAAVVLAIKVVWQNKAAQIMDLRLFAPQPNSLPGVNHRYGAIDRDFLSHIILRRAWSDRNDTPGARRPPNVVQGRRHVHERAHLKERVVAVIDGARFHLD